MNHQLIAAAENLLGFRLQYLQVSLGTRYADGFQDRTYFFDSSSIRIDEYREEAKITHGSQEFTLHINADKWHRTPTPVYAKTGW